MSKTLSMKAAQAAHEAWLAQHCAVVPADLDRKRAAMANDAFGFFRATCFRFAARFAGLLPAAAAQPAVPSIGDAHLENFGTWRDAEGRLVWGVNDLDEAAMLPWPTDLLRLATSALLTRGAPDAHVVQRALLDGYNAGLAAPRPFILDEAHAPMRDVAAPTPAARATFWAKIDRLPDGDRIQFHRRLEVGRTRPTVVGQHQSSEGAFSPIAGKDVKVNMGIDHHQH